MALAALDSCNPAQAAVTIRADSTPASPIAPQIRRPSQFPHTDARFRHIYITSRPVVHLAAGPHGATAAPELDVVEVASPESSDAASKPSQPGTASEVSTIPQIWANLAAEIGGLAAVHDPHQKPVTKATFRQLQGQMCAFASGLRELGLKKGQRVAQFAENSSRWLVADQGIMFNGAANAVRGSTTPCSEQAYIFRHSRSCGLVVQDAASLQRLLPYLHPASDSSQNRNGTSSRNGSSQNHHNGSNANGSSSSSIGSTSENGNSFGSYGSSYEANGSSSNGNGSTPTLTQSNGTSSGAESGSLSTPELAFVVLLWGDVTSEATDAFSCPVLTFDQVLERGRGRASDFEHVAVSPDDLATLVYTSGTTGQPKGVMLSHRNLFYQLSKFDHFIAPRPGDSTLSLLPPWHIYERTTGYYIFSRGCQQVYSTIKHFREDLTRFPPSYFVCVPLVLDTLHSRVWQTIRRGSAVKQQLARFFLGVSVQYVYARRILQGVALEFARKPRPFPVLLWSIIVAVALAPLHWLAGRLVYRKIREALGSQQAVISGGGSLQPHLDDFYEAVGIVVVNGWGLSETSPVLACRQARPLANVRGTVGRVIPGTELRVVNPETYADVEDGHQGLLLARGPGVMKGYFDNPSATAAAFVDGGDWFDTGDLGWRAPEGIPGSNMGGCLVLTGRSKDTIILASGENIEPAPLEDAICVSPLIKFATVVGQDRKHLGALLVPDLDGLATLAKERGMAELSAKEVAVALREEVTRATAKWSSREHIRLLTVLDEQYTPENGCLTRTMKPRRSAIFERFEKQIKALTDQL